MEKKQMFAIKPQMTNLLSAREKKEQLSST